MIKNKIVENFCLAEIVTEFQGMLTLLVEQCPKENGRAKAALDYLEHSRYRDYETALAYLSDSSAVCEKQIREVLKREIQKTTALTCH